MEKPQVLVKCGGFSTQLEKHIGQPIDGDPLWGSRFDNTNPAAVVQTHLDFLESGAQIVLSNTYQSSVEGFMKHLQLTREESLQLIRRSVQLAKEAKEKYLLDLAKTNRCAEPGLPLILASIGPYGAHLHDGSEYSGNYAEVVSIEEFQRWHRVRIEECLAEGVDGLAIETIPCLKEAMAVASMVLNDYPGVKFWVSFQCKDAEHLAHGEKFAEAVKTIWSLVQKHNATERLMGIGMNCLKPEFVAPLLKSALDLLDTRIPFVVYSNRGETYDTDIGSWTGREKCIPVESYVPEWINLGARIIGGCCRVYPKDIQHIRKCVDNIGNNN